MEQDQRDPRTYAIIGAAMEVHRELGCGFLEPVYQEALGLEMRMRDIPFTREVKLPVFYKGQRLETHYQADFICYQDVIVELKALAKTGGLERAQVLNYLKATGHKVGLLANFGAMSLEWQRLVK
jgi:GxxExxY protein